MANKKVGVEPLGDRVLVKPDAEKGEQKSKGGIIIPETVDKEKPQSGVVIAVGEGRWDEEGEKRIPMSVKVGDNVIFSKYSYDEVKIDEEDLYLIKEDNILAIIK